MKNAQLLFCLFFVTAAHCMENQEQESINPWGKIDVISITNALNLDYRNYCKNRLEEYKKVDFTPQDLIKIENMAITCTGNSSHKHTLYNVYDEDENRFPHIAIQKGDVAVLTWLMTKNFYYYPTNKQNNGFAESCLNLIPEKKQIAIEMLSIILTNQRKQWSHSIRKPIADKMMTLQIEHKKQHKENLFNDALFTPLLGHETNTPFIDLPTLYQQITDSEGNTFSHIVANSENPTELQDLMTKNYISPASNKKGETVVDIALKTFQLYTQNPSAYAHIEDQAQNAQCCLFMLLTYIKSKQI